MRERDTLMLVLLGIGGYLAYRALSGAASTAANAIAAPLANWYTYLTSTAAPVPQGVVVFPDMTTIPAASLPPITWYGNAATFQYNAQAWQLLSHDANGNYPAVPYVGA